jgi:hypothetical protein
MRTLTTLSVLSATLLLAACSASDEGSGASEDDATEAPKLLSRFADLKKIRTENLERLVAGYATPKLNAALSSNGNGVTFGTPIVFGASAEQNSIVPDGGKVRGIDAIVSGLATRFGDSDFSTRLNAARLAHLKSSSDKYYVESTIDLGAAVDHQWSFPAAGFAGASASLGFSAGGSIGARIVVASEAGGLQSAVKGAGAAVNTLRGFVVPRSAEDIRKLKTGEMFGLRGEGKLGANFGVGVPLLVASPGQLLGYSVVASGGVSAVLSGKLDVQLIRLEGDEVAVEVGMEDAQVGAFSAAIEGGWGVNTVCDDGQACLKTIQIAGRDVNLGKLVEKSLVSRLNETFKSRIAVSGSNSTSRVTISRIRFHLDRGDKNEVDKALQQALKADVRYAQAIYNRDLAQGAPSVTVDFDLLRSASTSTRDFGATIFGLDIYHRSVVENKGEFAIQTPEGTQAVLFDSFSKKSGWFQMDHGYKRTGIAALTLNAAKPQNAQSESNLFLQTVVGDSHMDDDLLLDNADALIAMIGGAATLAPLDTYGNAMERAVWTECPVQTVETASGPEKKTWDEKCNTQLLDPARKVVAIEGSKMSMVDAKTRGLAAFKAALAKVSIPEAHKQMLLSAAELRLTLQSVGIHNLDAANGPNVSFALNMRLDDAALTVLSKQSAASYKRALTEYVAAISTKRDEVTGERAPATDAASKWDATIGEMTKVFERESRSIRVLAETEQVRLPEALAGKRYAGAPMGIRFAIDDADYVKATMSSVSQQRAKASAKLFDGLLDTAKAFRGMDLYPEHAAAYPLLALVPANNLEVGMDVKADTASSFWVSRARFAAAGFKSVTASAKGDDVSTIASGLFNLDSLMQ